MLENASKRVTIVCCYNNEEEFAKFKDNVMSQTEPAAVLGVENFGNRFSSCAKALNSVLNSIETPYVIFSHQDILLTDRGMLETFTNQLEGLGKFDILGVAGAVKNGTDSLVYTNIYHGIDDSRCKPGIRIVDSDGQESVTPIEVESIDECFFGAATELFRENPFDEEICDAWHLYAVEYSLFVRSKGGRVFSSGVELWHKSKGNLTPDFFSTLCLLAKKYGPKERYITTTCAHIETDPVFIRCYQDYHKKDEQLRWFIKESQDKQVSVERLLVTERELEGEKDRLQGALICAEAEVQQLREKENQLRGELIRAQCAKNDLENDLTGQLNNAVIERDQLRDKENALNAQLSSVSLERDVLSERVVKYSCDLDRMREAEEELRGKLMCSEGECAQLRDKENQLLRTVSNKDAEYAALKHELACREAECAQLRGKENQLKADLEATRNSRTWRLARVFAGFVRFFVPVGSKRALFLRMLWTFIKHPSKFLKSLSPRKMKKFFRLLRRGNVEGIKLLIHSNITGVPAPSTIEVIAPEVVPVESEPVREKTVEDYPVIRVPQWEDPQVSIIIPVYNQFEFTYHCVESIIRNSGDITYEILIANDCSTDLTTHIDEILPGVKCITNEKNLRFLLNCNNAAKYAKGKYVLFLNNDTQVQPNWLEPLVTLIESAEDIGMVGSKLIYPDGLLQEAGGILWKDGSAWNFGNRQNPALPQFNYVKQVDYISGAAIMLSRALWEEIGGFDETFVPAYCEDSDLAFTVRKMGYRVMYQPLSVVVHFEGVSNGTDTSSGQKHYQVVNSKKFREKWAEELAKHPENAENVFQARDYSFGKPTLLMVDHYVPHFDKDAGSRTVYQYLRLFVKAGFNVKFIGDNFYQHEPYTTALQQMGVEVLYGPECAQHWKDWIRDNAEHIDYVFLNRPHIAPKYLEFIRQNTKARIIYYGHDLAFLREMREFEITGDSSFRDSAIEWKPKELALMRAADMAYYPSYVEVDEIHAIDPTVKVKAIPAYLFENVKWEGYDHGARKDIMFIGGFGHRPNVDAVKWIADEILPELLKYLPDVKIHILGSNAPKEVLELANEHLIIEGFVTDEQLEWFYRNMRISLVPLRYGAGIKGKVVEAMRFGTPVVTTSTGAEGIPDAEKAMLIEDDGKELARKLAELYNDAEKLVSMSENCIGYIQDNYSPSNAIRVIGPEFDLC